MITSMSNSQIKHIQQLMKIAKARRESGLFVVEGIKMFREAPKERIHRVYASVSFLESKDNRTILEEKGFGPGSPEMEEVEDKIFRSLSDTVTPQGILCLVRQINTPLSSMLETEDGQEPLLMILEDLQDPGNLGTILRTGEGAGVSGVILNKNCVDLYNPKVIRSTMGSVYRVPVLTVDSILDILPELKRQGVRTYAAHLQGAHFYDQENLGGKAAFFIGNEGNGLSDDLSGRADCLIKIPMMGQVESLNAAMAAGILMYEASRQRRQLLRS